MLPESSEGLNKETSTHICFFETAFGLLSNFSAHQVMLWGETFPTAEHAYQWKKFADLPDISSAIISAPSPEAVKKISNSQKDQKPNNWDTVKESVMEEILSAKAAQHEDVKQALQRSGSRIIVENSPWDDYWGSGPHGDGKNRLGHLWMKVRETSI